MASLTVTAVNTEVMMPTHRTRAKPRIGPEPSANSATPEIRWVTLASTMVGQAFS